MSIRKNIIKADIRSYPPYLIMGQPKVGKSQFFRDLILHLYGTEDKGLLISFGQEEGYLALDKLQYEVAEDWNSYEDSITGLRGFVQIVDQLIEEKEELGIEVIGLDTLDEMVEVATKEVFEIHREMKKSYPKSLNDALGGYGNGRKKVISLIKEQISRLNKAGFAIFIIAHTKLKDKSDIYTGESYEQITNNLSEDFYNSVANNAQMIVNIIQEKDIKDGKIVGEKRMMYFRDNGFVTAGGRFNGLPEKLPLCPESFMTAFNEGVKNSSLSHTLTDEEIKVKKDEESKSIEEKSKNNKKIDEEKRRIDIVDKISDLIQSSPEKMESIKPIISKNKITSLKDENIPIKVLSEILNILTK